MGHNLHAQSHGDVQGGTDSKAACLASTLSSASSSRPAPGQGGKMGPGQGMEEQLDQVYRDSSRALQAAGATRRLIGKKRDTQIFD